MKRKLKRDPIFLLAACFLILALIMIYGCSAAKKGIAEAEYQDGIYKGASKIVEGGGYSEITIEIIDNSITNASIVEYYGDQRAKDPASYLIPVENGEGYILGEILAALESQIVERNTYDVDIITGATETCIKVIQATYSALQKSQKEVGGKSDIEEDRDIKEVLEKEPCKP
jgi:uncharacterized protein with FMN-binding domain